MEHESPELTLLEKLDRRQNHVLQELDQLNERIEQTLKEWMDQRSDVATNGV